jgi:DNA-directed RNA polymerase subunit K/omega
MTGGAKKKLAKPAIIQKKTMDYDDDEEEDDSDPEDEDEVEDEDFVPNDVDETDKKKIAGVVVDSDVDEYDDDDDDEDEDDEDEDDTEKPKKKAAVVKAPIAVIPQVIGSDDEDEDNEDDDENYLQKFDIDVNRNYINEFHPECVSHNYDEISKMSNVIRDDNGIIVDPLHMTIPFLTKYERARVLGQRAKQIETGSKPLVKVPENIIDGYLIAEIELEQKKIPFIIRRPLPNGGSEYWRLSDLQIIAF